MIDKVPALTIIITACDRPIIFKRALDSVIKAAQKIDRLVEIIIVNDGQHQANFDVPPIQNIKRKYIESSKGPYGGVANARNDGLAISTGEYVLFLDDDDSVIVDGPEIMLKKARHQNLDFVYGDAEYIHETRNLNPVRQNTMKNSHRVFETIFVFNFIPIGGFIIKRQIIHCGFDASLASHEDWDFLIANTRDANIGVVESSVVNIHFCKERDNRNPEGISNDSKKEKYDIHKQIHQRYPAPKLQARRDKLLEKLAPLPLYQSKTIVDCQQMELLVINPRETVQRSLLISKQFEEFIPNLAIALLSKTDGTGDVLDIGASLGSFAIPVARALYEKSEHKQKVHCFECQKPVFLHLCSNILINHMQSVVEPYHRPVSDKIEKISIPVHDSFEQAYMGSVSLRKDVINTRAAMPKVAEPDTDCDQYDVMESTTLDSEFDNADIALIKIDVEGMESQILRGGKTLINKARPFILTESWALDEFKKLRNELLELLSSFDYTVFQRDNDIVAIPTEKLNHELEQTCHHFQFIKL